MTKFFRLSILMAILAIAVMGCKKDKNDDNGGGGTTKGVLSPPAWIQGTWGLEGFSNYDFKFTSDDIIALGVSFSQVYNANTPEGSASVKETKKTDAIYEVTIETHSVVEGDWTGVYSFKKGDGTYIEIGVGENGEAIEDYMELIKK
jgi:hypothetical protein